MFDVFFFLTSPVDAPGHPRHRGRHLDRRPLLFAPGKVSVVIHLRRADLERDDTRATADSYYYRLAKEMVEQHGLFGGDMGRWMWIGMDRYG